MTGEAGYQSGFISIIGAPNVGKSTLMNRLVGQKISIVSDRAQTTRNRVMGVCSRSGYQIVFLDTPGVTTPKNRLGEYMLRVAYESLSEVDAIVFMVDAARGIGAKDEALIEKLRTAKAPVLAALNKVDFALPEDKLTARERLKKEAFLRGLYEISALNGQGLAELESRLRGYLPEGPQYFPDDMVTDQPERVLCGEILREKALMLLREEVPHGLGVGIDKMQQREDGLMDVWATIYCERDSHKGIIIGKQGSMLKRIGTDARKDIEWLLGTRVNLQLWVKVKEDWRNSAAMLNELGYE
ncbi:MAG: GTPase Era [Christensenellaceae bacterium]|jgi:GTP-binding protein Era|nr:GTPase Era [Christensenellaceae bacterium]